MRTIKEALDAVVSRWNLLNHPFYRAWNKGTLPVEALREYAREYGAFIKELPVAWRTLQDEETAHEEEEHIEMWEKFACAMGTSIGLPQKAAVQKLVEKAQTLFRARASALGALYAFEAQQPETALSKLEGLKKHYEIDGDACQYFEVHSKNHHEAEKILHHISNLHSSEQESAIRACEEMCIALWDALTDLTPECGKE